MDPDANLKELRELVAAINKARDTYENVDGDSEECDVDRHDVYRMASLIEALDEWIAKGGFLPKEWGR